MKRPPNLWYDASTDTWTMLAPDGPQPTCNAGDRHIEFEGGAGVTDDKFMWLALETTIRRAGRPIVGGPLHALGDQGWTVSPPPVTATKIVVGDPNDERTWETVVEGSSDMGVLVIPPDVYEASRERIRAELGAAWTGRAADYWANAEAINHGIVQALIAQTDAETPDERGAETSNEGRKPLP